VSSIAAITYEGAKTVTVSDTAGDPAGPFAGLWILITGALKFQTLSGDTVTLTSAEVTQIITGNGGFLPVAVSRVWSTGTAATVLGLTAQPYRVS
jgi:hypothetical protein